MMSFRILRALTRLTVARVRLYRELRRWRRAPEPSAPPTPWHLEGTCTRCGQCCRRVCWPVPIPGLRWSPFARLAGSLLARFLLPDVEPVGVEQGHYLVFRCLLQTPDGLCSRYETRPAWCRNYPDIYGPRPPILFRGCGFRVVVDAPLPGAQVPPERRRHGPPGPHLRLSP